MVKTDITRWYDIQCDAPNCERLISAEYQQCICWALPTQAVNAAIEAGWQRREEDGLEHMYCQEHRTDVKLILWFAKCDVCGRKEYLEAAHAFVYACDKFTQRGWKIKSGTCGVPTTMICPDCAEKGQAK